MFLISILLYSLACFAVFCLLGLVIILYSIIHISTTYDKQSDDDQQIMFLRTHSIL